MLRSRKSKISLDAVRNLDTFPKLPDTFVETSRVGATCKHSSLFIIKYSKDIRQLFSL